MPIRVDSPVEDDCASFGSDDDDPDPPSENEEEPDDNEEGSVFKMTSAKDLPREDDFGCTAYGDEKADPPEPKKRKKTPTEPVALSLERQYTVYQPGDDSFPEPHAFEKHAAGTSGSDLHAFLNCTPFEIMMKLWMGCMDWIVAVYNQRIVEERSAIKPITIGVLATWYGIRLYMSLYKRPNERSHFRDINCGDRQPTQGNLCNYMSWANYKEVKANMRYEHYHTKSAEDKKYKAWKVKTIFNKVKTLCKLYMPAPGEHISIDEAMVLGHMACPVRVAMPAKPIDTGILFYCAVCFLTKWVFNLDLCDGKFTADQFKDVPWGLTGFRVLELVKHLRGKWHSIYTDNFYTSEALAAELLRNSQYLIGTMRKNRLPKGKPEGFLTAVKHPKPTLKCPKGTISAIVNGTKNVAVYSMMDSSMVYILDTKYGPVKMSDMLRRQKAGEIVILSVYEGIVMYNKKMGAVDTVDQMRTGYYSVEMHSKSKKWTNRFVDSMFNFQLTQAWVAYRYLNPSVAKYGRQEFNESICGALLDNKFDDKRCYATRAKEEKESEDLRKRSWGYHHSNAKMDVQSGCDRGDGSARIDPKPCVHCINMKTKGDKRTTDCCKECDVPLHQRCHADYHNAALIR